MTIVEKYLGGKKFFLSEIDTILWKLILEEAQNCLDKNKQYKGRAIQEVTEKLKNGYKKPKQLLGVSPHLTIQTHAGNINDTTSNIENELQEAFVRLNDIYAWVASMWVNGRYSCHYSMV